MPSPLDEGRAHLPILISYGPDSFQEHVDGTGYTAVHTIDAGTLKDAFGIADPALIEHKDGHLTHMTFGHVGCASHNDDAGANALPHVGFVVRVGDEAVKSRTRAVAATAGSSDANGYHCVWSPVLGFNVSSTHGKVTFENDDMTDDQSKEIQEQAVSRATRWAHVSGKPEEVRLPPKICGTQQRSNR